MKSRNESAGLDLGQACGQAGRGSCKNARIWGLCLRCLTFLRNRILLWLCHRKAASKKVQPSAVSVLCLLNVRKLGVTARAPGSFPSRSRAEMEMRTFAVGCHVRFSECFLSFISRTGHPAASALLVQGVIGPNPWARLGGVSPRPQACSQRLLLCLSGYRNLPRNLRRGR